VPPSPVPKTVCSPCYRTASGVARIPLALGRKNIFVSTPRNKTAAFEVKNRRKRPQEAKAEHLLLLLLLFSIVIERVNARIVQRKSSKWEKGVVHKTRLHKIANNFPLVRADQCRRSWGCGCILFWTKLIRFGQIWLDLGEIWAKLERNLGNIVATFG